MDYILLMHNDATTTVAASGWQPYLQRLQAAGKLRGGSAIAEGTCFRRDAAPAPMTCGIVGFIHIEARDIAEANTFGRQSGLRSRRHRRGPHVANNRLEC